VIVWPDQGPGPGSAAEFWPCVAETDAARCHEQQLHSSSSWRQRVHSFIYTVELSQPSLQLGGAAECTAGRLSCHRLFTNGEAIRDSVACALVFIHMVCKNLATTSGVCLSDLVRSLCLRFAFSCGLILFNKWILFYQQFRFPLSLSFAHMLSGSAMAFFTCRVLKMYEVPTMTWSEYRSTIVPIATCFCASLSFSNQVRRYPPLFSSKRED